MFKKEKAPMGEKDMQSTWEYLVKQERLLRRNRIVCRIVQPVGALLFLFNLLLATCNFAIFALEDKLPDFFSSIPVIPGMVENFPRGSWFGVIAFTLCFAYLIPLAVSACVMLAFLLHDRKKYKTANEPLVGNHAQRAKALTNKAEMVYELRKRIPTWAIYLETGILTGLTAVPLVVAMVRVVGEGPAVLQFAIYSLALLVVLFALFWVYALLFKIFSLLNSLFYISAGEWSYYELYQKLDAYWESVDPQEYARREHKRQLAEDNKLRNRRLRKSAPAKETAE